ncbi:MAG: sulfite exporter TauE/SafE family protein, partial [Patescibacteria group bacterium]
MEELVSVLGLHGYSAIALSYLVGGAFVAGLARGFSGFGAGLIYIPIASAVIGSKLAVPLLLILEIAATAGLIPDAWRRAERREAGVMMLGALIGVPIGAYILTKIDPVIVRWILVASIVPMLALLVSGWRYHRKPALPLSVVVGTVSGFFSGFAQIGGPPVIMYWLGGQGKPDTVRANLVLFFVGNIV